MKVRYWGTRGSLATPGLATAAYGGNTSCVAIEGSDGTSLVLDAGTGIRPLSSALPESLTRIDVLLTHLHMDHIQGLGFFGPLYRPDVEVHVWGPASATVGLRERLMRYLSPPLFPVRLRDLPCDLHLHEVPCPEFRIGSFRILSQRVCHPGPTVGYRIVEEGGASLAYIPDHEPALGTRAFPVAPEWTSGAALAEGADLLIHDAQYLDAEYPRHVGWGHSAMSHALALASQAGVRTLAPFHYDPGHDDAELDRAFATMERARVAVVPAREGGELILSPA